MAYTPEELATIAKATAKKYGCEAVRWWQDKGNPRQLWIEARYKLSNGQWTKILLTASLPDKGEDRP